MCNFQLHVHHHIKYMLTYQISVFEPNQAMVHFTVCIVAQNKPTQRAQTCFPRSVRTKHSFFRNRQQYSSWAELFSAALQSTKLMSMDCYILYTCIHELMTNLQLFLSFFLYWFFVQIIKTAGMLNKFHFKYLVSKITGLDF